MANGLIFYLHGFRSSSQSWKARELSLAMRARGQEERLWIPDLPWEPAAAIQLVETRLSAVEKETVTLVGSSLGGHYATWLAERHRLKVALVNPAVIRHLSMASWLGVHRHLYRDESFEFTEAHGEALRRLEAPCITPERYLLLLEKGDKVLDYRHALARYAGCRQIVLEGGEHGFSQFPRFIEQILEFAGL
jgi:predicted esterase YcpF (UPF0227 family)